MVSRQRPYGPFEAKHVRSGRRMSFIDSLFPNGNSVNEELECREELESYRKHHYDGGMVAPREHEESEDI